MASILLTLTPGIHMIRLTAVGGTVTVSNVVLEPNVAVAHTVRIEGQGGVLPTTPLGSGLVELDPGADIPTASVAATGGAVSLRGRLALPAATAASAGGAIAFRGAVGLPAATTASSANPVAWTGGSITEHVVRFDGEGTASQWCTLVPGADTPAATAVSTGGAVGVSATLGLPAATATTEGGSLSGGVPLPAATAVSSAGSIGQRGVLALPWAESYVEAGWITVGTPLPAATAASGAGAIAITARVPVPAATIHQLPMFIGGGSTADLPPGRIRRPRAYVIDPLPPQPVAPKAVSSIPGPVPGKASST